MPTSSSALEVISSANLTPTEHLLLEHFVEKAVDPDLAAQHLVSRVQQDAGVEVEACLRSFKQDWRKLIWKCKYSETRQSTSRLIIHSGDIRPNLSAS